MAPLHRHLLPDGTPVYSGYEVPCDDSGVDLALVDEMLALTPAERLERLEAILSLLPSGRSPEDASPGRADGS